MRNLLKRVEALETWLLPEEWSASKPDPKGDDEIMRLAGLRLSGEDREIVEGLSSREEPCRDLTEREDEVLEAFVAAITIECRSAGYRSFDEFHTSYCGGK
ncbi:MAG: hypothetical protein ABSH47_27920 [Bryobacteraceae bacterium]|jgi:hypothetical protein